MARENGPPAVVGTRVATGTVREGLLIEDDGDRGRVRILADG